MNTVIEGNVHALVLDNECWLITAEFCGAFLNLTLDAFNISIQEKQYKLDRRIINQVDNPTIFKQLARYYSKTKKVTHQTNVQFFTFVCLY